jgi:hypothetical protein
MAKAVQPWRVLPILSAIFLALIGVVQSQGKTNETSAAGKMERQIFSLL